MKDDRGLPDQVVELERLDEVSVPDQRAVADGEITHSVADRRHFAQSFFEHLPGPKDRAVILHRALHCDADFTGLQPPFCMTHTVEPGKRRICRRGLKNAMSGSWLDDLGGALRSG